MPSTTDPTDDAPPARESTLSRRRLLGAAAAAGAAGLAGCTTPFVRVRAATKTVEHRFDAGPVSRLRVEGTSDDVSIERTDGDAVRVRVHKRARGDTGLSELGLQSRVEDGVLHLGTRTPSTSGVGGSADLEVSVPASVGVGRVRTADGDLALRGVSGDPTAETGDGDVAVTGVSGDVAAATDDGDVAVERAGGTVTARSGDGDVAVRAPGAVADLRTDDGDVVATVPAVDGSATVRSGDGDVTVSLGGTLDATVEVTTGDGRVTVAGGVDSVETATEHRVTGTVGDGTNELRVHADDGDVTVSRFS